MSATGARHDWPAAPPHPRAHLLAAAGLVHDLGKLLEPAGVPLDAMQQQLEQIICPTGPDGRGTHRHVLWTARALDDIRSDWGGIDRRELFAVACNHHRPSAGAENEQLLTRADRMASGHDRRAADTDAPQRITGVAPALAHLFGHEPAEQQALLPTTDAADTARFLPAPRQAREDYAAACRALVPPLVAALSRDWRSPAHCVTGVQAALAFIADRVPASRRLGELADISLYDHSRVVAAFAAALGVLADAGHADAARVRLAAWGLGGIQTFLFRTVPALDGVGGGDRGMARTLRARSALVVLLGHLVARRVLEATGLPSVSHVLDAGGRGLVLLPDEPQLVRRADAALAQAADWVRSRLGGGLRLDIALTEPLHEDALGSEAFAARWREVAVAVDEARYRLPGLPLRDDAGWRPDAWVGAHPGLPVDGAAWANAVRALGRHLPDAIGFTVGGGPGLLQRPLELLGYRVQLHDGRSARTAADIVRFGPDAEQPAQPVLPLGNHVPRATRDDVVRLERAGWRSREAVAAAASATVANESEAEVDEDDLAPREHELLTFDQLAHLATDGDGTAMGHAMLGCLKADVDSLGVVMGHGFGDRVSLGRVAAVSRAMDAFFRRYLPARLAQVHPKAYVVFGGGDDLLVIGPWLDLVRLAGDLYADFRRGVADNPCLTLSAAVTFSKPRVPVRLLAGAADAALTAAKDAGRNRVAIGSVLLPWPRLVEALALADTLTQLGERQRALLYRLVQYADMGRRAAAWSQGGTVPLADLKWRAQLAYDLRRNLRGGRDGADALRERLMAVRTDDDLAALRVAATLALYRLRGGTS